MGVHSGKYGVVNGADTVRNWSIGEVSTIPRYAASNTQSGTGRTRGVNSWTGSYARYGHSPLHLPSELFTFEGYTAPDSDTLGGTGQVFTGTAMVDSIAITWDWTTQLVISQVVNFSGHMVLAASDAFYEDLTDPDPPETHGTKLVYGADFSTAAIELEHLTTATLTLSAPSTGYVNSSTYDAASDKVWTGRKGGIFDWTLSMTVQNTKRSDLPAIEAIHGWKLFGNATEFWGLDWGRVRDYSGITVDIETGAIIQATVNVDMAGFKSGSGAGSVVDPGGLQVWPFVLAS